VTLGKVSQAAPRKSAINATLRFMRHTKHIHTLLAAFLMASVTFAQTRDGQVAVNAAAENKISAARSRYIQTADTSPDVDNTTLAQLHRGGPGRPFPPPRGYPRATYQTPWMDHGNGGHILIGAAIGFGIGAAIGANNSAHNGTPVAGGILIGGGLFGFLGGCVGKAVGDLQGLQFASTHHRRTYRPSGPEDDEESELQSHSKLKEDHSEASTSAAAPIQSTSLEPATQASLEPTTPGLRTVSASREP
jgi:hypothetical protein